MDVFPVAHPPSVPLSVPSPSCSKGAIHVAKVPSRAMRGWIEGNGEMDTPGTPGVVGRCGIFVDFLFMTQVGRSLKIPNSIYFRMIIHACIHV